MSAARYSKVTRRLWGDETFRSLRAAEASPRELWLYLLTCPEQCAVPGIFRAFEGGVADALGWSPEALRECWVEVSAKGLARADWRAGVVVLPKAFFHNQPESPNHVLGWRSAWDEVPECQLKTEYYHTIKALVEGLGEGYAKAFAKGLREPYRYQEQEQEQEQERGALLRPAPPPRQSEPMLRERANRTDDGCFGDAVGAWEAGISEEIGEPFVKLTSSTEIAKLISVFRAKCPNLADREAWAKKAGAEFARSGESRNVHRFVDWVNNIGRKAPPKSGTVVVAQPKSPYHKPIASLRPVKANG